jgi:hypothetical protein
MPKSPDDKTLTSSNKWVLSVYSAVLFFIIASPFVFKLVNSITTVAGVNIATDGCPNMYGLAVHALVFGLVVRVLMSLQLPGA